MFKHLHGRGEDCGSCGNASAGTGNTSTDVEKTNNRPKIWPSNRKHLHGRGEDGRGLLINTAGLETPPRTWRRHYQQVPDFYVRRNTSTDVEKTARFGIKSL